MNVIEGLWILLAFVITSITLVIDPKASSSSPETIPVSGLFSSASAGQTFLYKFSAVLIILFYILTILLSSS